VDRVHGAVDRHCTRVHDGPREVWTLGAACLADMRNAGARAHRSSPVVAKGDEGDEAVPEGCSPEHERRWRGGAMVVECSGGSFTSREQ
jgi:hypothetical protein